MPEAPKTRKANRPRIDAIVSHIKKGSYDEEIEKIQEAIKERNQHRRDEVLKLVKRVYGERATVDTSGVTPEPTYESGSHAKVARRARPGGPPQAEATELPPELAEAEQAALARERQLAAEEAAQVEPSDPEDEVISNSPLIGSMASE